jgi:hypothetical protein
VRVGVQSVAQDLRDLRPSATRVPLLVSLGLALAGAVWIQRRSRRRAFSAASLFGRRRVAQANAVVRELGYPLLAFLANQVGRRAMNRWLEKVGPLEAADHRSEQRLPPAAGMPVSRNP